MLTKNKPKPLNGYHIMNGNNSTDRPEVQWSPRVPKWKVRRLYEFAAKGIWHDELIDDVGLTLYLRCRDILLIHQALTERKVTCPTCLRQGASSIIQRHTGSRDELLECPVCSWQMTWYGYHKTFKRHQLNPGGAVSFFREFVSQYDRAQTAKERMMTIDRVIHQFHYSLKDQPDLPTRPAGVNLIVGQLKDVVQFLDELSGLPLPGELQETYTTWRRTYDATFWPAFLQQEGDQRTE